MLYNYVYSVFKKSNFGTPIPNANTANTNKNLPTTNPKLLLPFYQMEEKLDYSEMQCST